MAEETGRVGRHSRRSALAWVAIAGCMTEPAWSVEPVGAAAAVAVDSGLQEIVVTAQRREEHLQNVPISVAAVSAETLQQVGITDTMHLDEVVPNLSMTRVATYELPRIRAVGNTNTSPGAENSVSTYIDGVYLASPSASLLALNNIERIEVLEGPQGTLFGRNATGGLIQIITRDPQQAFSGDVHVGLGNYMTPSADLYVTGGISGSLAADFAAVLSSQDQGWGTNFVSGRGTERIDRDIALRNKWKLDLGSDTTVTLALDYENLYIRNYLFTPPANYPPALYRGAPLSPYPPVRYGTPYDVDTDTQNDSYVRGGGASVTAHHGLDDLDLVSITSYRDSYVTAPVDGDQGPEPFASVPTDRGNHNYSQEFQVNSNKAARLKWTAGLYYFNAFYDVDPQGTLGTAYGSPTSGQLAYNKGQTISYAGYAQAVYEVLPDTHLTGGVRYLYEKRDATFLYANVKPTGSVFSPAAGASVSYDKPIYHAVLDHQFTPDVLGYISYSTGWKSGGYNLSYAAPNPGATVPYRPETLSSYELGFKSELFDHKLRVNSSAFYYNYTNIQVLQYNSAGSSSITNGASAKVIGLEGDAEYRVTTALSLKANVGYTNSRFDQYDNAQFFDDLNPASRGYLVGSLGSAAGNRLPLAPVVTGDVGATYSLPSGAYGNFSFAGNTYYSGGWYSDPNNEFRQPAYVLTNVSSTWTSLSDKYSVRLWCDNVADKYYVVQWTVVPKAFVGGVSPGAPRTYGVTVGMKF